MKIVICDDNSEELSRLYDALENIFQQHNTPLDIISFTSGRECYTYLESYSADIVFFDIYLQDSLGVELALQLRQQGRQFKLIFLTTSNEFANESYEAQATYYLLKPTTMEKLEQALKRCDAFTDEGTITITAERNSQLSLDPKKIIAIEVKDKYCFVYTPTQTYRFYSSMSRMREQLPQDYFLLVHRSFLINMHYVEAVEDDAFVMCNGFRAPMRVRDAKTLRNQYMQWSLDHI